jgi:hypothetical protein
MLAALLNVPANVGYPLLFVLVGAESAGAFVPGETSLIVPCWRHSATDSQPASAAAASRSTAVPRDRVPFRP